MAELLFSDSRFRFGLDTMRIAKKGVAKGDGSIPAAYNLKQLYQFVTGRAYDDVRATIQVLRHEPFWEARKDDVFEFTAGLSASAPTASDGVGAGGSDDDSASVGGSDSSSQSSSSLSDDEEEDELEATQWEDMVD